LEVIEMAQAIPAITKVVRLKRKRRALDRQRSRAPAAKIHEPRKRTRAMWSAVKEIIEVKWVVVQAIIAKVVQVRKKGRASDRQRSRAPAAKIHEREEQMRM
jgi:hypothetical protein